MCTASRILFATLVAVAFTVATSWIQPVAAQPRAPTQVRIEGHAGSAPEGVRPRASWRLEVDGEEKPFALGQLVVLTPGAATSSSILGQIRAQRGTILVVGSEENRKAIAEAPDGKALTITGNLRWTGGRSSLLVDGVTGTTE